MLNDRSARAAIDGLDAEILRLLSEDARLSLNEIARRLGVSPATVAVRVRRMEREGVIRGYTVKVDHEKLGLGIEAFVEVTFSRGMLLETEERIARLPGVVAVYDVTGECDAIVHVVVRDKRELSNLIKTILAMPFVERTVTKVVLNKVKEELTYVPRSLAVEGRRRGRDRRASHASPASD